MTILGFFAESLRARSSLRGPRQTRLQLECLESRVVPYATTGNLWPNPQLITVSFVPDGTNLGGPASNLFATFNAAFGSASAWQNQILKALQSYAQQANVNFTVVSDNGAASGGGNYEQGDPGMGDIRIGGFNMNNSGILALGYMPPSVNNYSIAGDIGFNTAQVFNINGWDYDLFTVAAHEVGHALGLSESNSSNAVMYGTYQGVAPVLSADDVAGIRSIYGPRQPDAYDAASPNGSFATATNLTSLINASSLTAQATNLDITTTSQAEYYEFTAPSGGSGKMTVSVQSKGLSLLAPSLKVYNAGQTQLASATGSGELGSTLTTTVTVTAGQQYYVRVAGANTTAFGTGDYALTVNFGTSPTPAVASPNTQKPNGNPMNGGGGLADRTDSNGLSVESLLGDVGDLVNDVGGLLGLGGLGNGWGGGGELLDDLPFVSAMQPGERFQPGANAATQHAALASLPTTQVASLGSTDAVAVLPTTFSPNPVINSGSFLPAPVATMVAAPLPRAMLGVSPSSSATLLSASSSTRIGSNDPSDLESDVVPVAPARPSSVLPTSEAGRGYSEPRVTPAAPADLPALPATSTLLPAQTRDERNLETKAQESCFTDPTWLGTFSGGAAFGEVSADEESASALPPATGLLLAALLIGRRDRQEEEKDKVAARGLAEAGR